MQYFVRSGALLGFADRVRERGENPISLMADYGLSPAVVQDPDLYLSYPALARLMAAAAQRCAQPDFGVQLGMRQGLEAVGALGSAMCLQSSVGEALRMMQRNLDFHAKGVEVSVVKSEQYIDIRMDFAFANDENCEQLAGLSLALLARCLQQLQCQPLAPVSLLLRRAEGDAEAYYKVFACRPYFAMDCDALRYPIALLDAPVQVESRVREGLSRQWRGGRSADAENLGQLLDQAITALLPTGECSLAMVARVIGMHPRTLQQRLKDQGSSFSKVLAARRLYLAREHLQFSDIDLTTLALNLGFSELPVFSRAFKAWTGSCPREWRKRVQA